MIRQCDPDLLPVYPPPLSVQEEHRSLQVRPTEQNVVESLETRKPDPGASLVLKQCFLGLGSYPTFEYFFATRCIILSFFLLVMLAE